MSLQHNAFQHNAVQSAVPGAGASAVPRGPSRAVFATVTAAWSVVTVAPLFVSVALANTNDPTISHPSRQVEQAAVVRALHPEPSWGAQARPKLVPIVQAVVNDPPLSSQKYRGEWPPLTWEAQARPDLTRGNEISQPPFSSKKYAGEWPVLTWEAQARPKLIPGGEINLPPGQAERYFGDFTVATWEAQARPKLVPITQAVVGAPPGERADALASVLAHHYVVPMVSPLWGRALTVEGAPVTPVDDPPFQMRFRQDQPVDQYWIPRALTGIAVARQAESVDAPPPLEPRYRGEWPELAWSTQTRPTLVQAGAAAPIDNPPFRQKKYAGEWAATAWEAQARPKLVPIAPSVVNDPPFSGKKYAGEWAATAWEAQARPKLVPIVQAVVNDPPFSGKKYAGDCTPASWEVQARPKLVPIPPRVDDPVPSARRHYQFITATWTATTWPTQSRIPLSYDGTKALRREICVALGVQQAVEREAEVSREVCAVLDLSAVIERDGLV